MFPLLKCVLFSGIALTFTLPSCVLLFVFLFLTFEEIYDLSHHGGSKERSALLEISPQPFPSPLPACSVFRVPPVLIPMLFLTYIPGEKKKQILWICLISGTKRLLEVSLCWDAYKKVWAWSSKLICCQIELNNFLLLSCLAASSLGGGASGL